ncbi:MAG: PEP-CTERM sorting domain-containing protein [Vicinamibacterales bacterium]
MREFLTAAVLVLAVSRFAGASPLCVSDTLANYVALGPAGCEIQGVTLTDFDVEAYATGWDLLDPEDVQVIPSWHGGPQIGLQTDSSVGPGERAGAWIGFTASRPSPLSLRGGRNSLDGGSTTDDGSIFGGSTYCLGAAFGAARPLGCSGTIFSFGTPVFVIPTGSNPVVALPFPLSSSLVGVSLFLTLDGGTTGSAALAGTFGHRLAVPEPSRSLLFGVGALALWLVSRRLSQR